MPRFKGFIGPSYTLRSETIDAQRCLNLFLEKNEMGTGPEGEMMYLLGTPGLKPLVTLPTSPIRGQHKAANGQFFVVSGNKFYRIDSSFGFVEIGTLKTSTGNVGMADNGIDVMIVDGDNGYTHKFDTTIMLDITADGFLGSVQVRFLDGYFVLIQPDTGFYYITDLLAITFPELDFASAEASPDNNIALLTDHRELWIFGEETIEGFYNSGATDFPFVRIQGGLIEHGCAAAFSVAKMNNIVFWLSKDLEGQGVVYQASGFNPQRISTHAVEFAIQGYGDISGATAYTYEQEGHFFYALNFPTADTTWVYDTSTGLWHERVFTNSTGQYERHRANYHSFAHSTHVVGDYANGKLYQLDLDTFTDDGDAITRLRSSPHITSDLNRIFYKELQLDIEAGVGLNGAAQGSDPVVFMRFSNDGGFNWSNEKARKIGKIGKKKNRVRWTRLGQARDRVFELKMTDPVKTIWRGARLKLEQGND